MIHLPMTMGLGLGSPSRWWKWNGGSAGRTPDRQAHRLAPSLRKAPLPVCRLPSALSAGATGLNPVRRRLECGTAAGEWNESAQMPLIMPPAGMMQIPIMQAQHPRPSRNAERLPRSGSHVWNRPRKGPRMKKSKKSNPWRRSG